MNRFNTSQALPISVLIIALWMLHHFTSAPTRIPLFKPVSSSSLGQTPSPQSETLPLETEIRINSPDQNQIDSIPVPPALQIFAELSKKSFRSRAEKIEFNRLIRSRSVLREAFALVDAPSQAVRDVAMALIESALVDGENPEAQFVVDEVERVIFADDLHQNLAPKVRQQRAADKGELMLSYLGAHPTRIERLLSSTSGTSNQKLVENVLQIAERRRQDSVRLIKELNEGS